MRQRGCRSKLKTRFVSERRACGDDEKYHRDGAVTRTRGGRATDFGRSWALQGFTAEMLTLEVRLKSA